MSSSTESTKEEKLHEAYKSELRKLEETIRISRSQNKTLSQQLYEAKNRSSNVAESMGFKSFDELAQIVIENPDVWNFESIMANHNKVNHSSCIEGDSPPKDNTGNNKTILREEFEELRRQVQALQHGSHDGLLASSSRSSNDQVPHGSASSSKLPEKTSSSEVFELQAKLKLMTDKYDKLLATKEAAERKYNHDSKKWKEFKSWLFKTVFKGGSLPDGHPEFPDVSFNASPHPIGGFALRKNFLSSPAGPSGQSENIPSTTMDDTRPHTISGPRISSDLEISCDSPTPVSRKRKTAELQLKLKSSPGKGRSPLTPSKVLNSPSTSKLPHPEDKEKSDTINKCFEINKDANNGLDYQYDEVVRGKQHRHQLDAGDCDLCKEYYNRLEPLPSPPRPPMWKSPSTTRIADFSTPQPSTSHSHTKRNFSESHKKKISRHRYKWSPPRTPPDYWNIGFPTTQEAEDINRRAEEMHEEKRRRIEAEADKVGGKYVRRKNP
ncbi:DNA repair endonuclease SAE2 ctip carboxy-terminal [Pyrrhoderma noxium]|uniref:DNA repair endonuclease SAE2 ctip carboxy-terminal n=1 Tax=Pyrrhoderma noxium TaxID=2282107 RepID=A0A286URY2_9AGAM|nr:DNA repair endonuclease SAE2 ctip carboxy-terminal [Pyrrhoderma noxium]